MDVVLRIIFLYNLLLFLISYKSTTFFISGYRIHAGSASPTRRRDDHRYISDFDHSGGLTRGREFAGGRDFGRYRDTSPHYSRRISGGRPFGRGFDGPGLAPGPFRGERSKNNPNVRPREGDWYCSDPL